MTVGKEISLVGTDFKIKDVESLLKLKGHELRDAVFKTMAEDWKVEGEAEDAKVAILLDFYSFLVHFSRKSSFTAEKASCFLSVAKRVHDASVTQVLTMANSLALLKNLLLKHSVHRPPYSVGVFTLKELQLVTEYMVQTYYKHYNLYQFVYVKVSSLGPIQVLPPQSRDASKTNRKTHVRISSVSLIHGGW